MHNCNICTNRIVRHKPSLFCDLCESTSHYRCSKLTKLDASNIIQSGHSWTCYKCNVELFPFITSVESASHRSRRGISTPAATTASCGACNKRLGGQFEICPWCELGSHKRCIIGQLGCVSCVTNMIPGFYYTACELLDNSFENTSIFNPYADINATLTDDNDRNPDYDEAMFWQEASACLLNCNYRQHKTIPASGMADLKIFSHNIRSLYKNITHLRDDIGQYTKFDILCFNETSCVPDNSAGGIADFELDGFHTPIMQKPSRVSGKGGGLAIYVNKNTCNADDFKTVDRLCSNSSPSAGEFLFVEVKVRKNVNKTAIVGALYRSPSASPSNFLESMKSNLQWLERHKNKHVIICGDTNIDLIQHENDLNAQNLSDLTLSHGYTEVISRPTRITDHSATLLDHIYTNSLSLTTSTGILINDLSDHLGTYINLNMNSTRVTQNFKLKSNHTAMPHRKFTTENIDHFKRLIGGEMWHEVDIETDAQDKFNKFEEIYTKHYNTAFPEVISTNKRKNQRKNPKPWILPWLEDACDRKYRLYKDFVRYPTIANETKYKKMKKFVEKHIKLAKNKYYTAYFKEHHANSKKQWQMLNSLLNRGQKKGQTSKLISENGTVISTPKDIANSFNDYFCGIASSLKAKINVDNTHSFNHNHFLGPSVADSIQLHSSDPFEIQEHIRSLKNKATADTKSDALKAVVDDMKFVTAFSSVLNASMTAGIFPEQLKIAKVCPIHKSGSKTDVANYRPISLLPVFSKVFEKALHRRLSAFLDKNNTIYNYQFGFRKQHSCEHALLAAQSSILHALNKKQIAMLLLIDFSKAFDMVDHIILLKKLEHYGIRGIALKLLESYLKGRQQSVTISSATSSYKHLSYGVPQGSILGPLLFVVYINDMPNIHKLVKFILYADDANIIITGANAHEIIYKYRELSVALANWVAGNGLMLNVRKTNFMIFSNVNIGDLINYQPTINGIPIDRKHVAKFLGVFVDEKLKWTSHIKSLSTKMSRNCGMLYKMKGILPQKAMLTLYHSFIQSHLNYCSLIWGLGSKNSIKALFVCQKKAMRTLIPGYVNYYYNKTTKEPPNHTKQAFNENKILVVHSLILKNLMLFMHKLNYHAHLVPDGIKAIFPSSTTESENIEVLSERLVSEVNSMFVKGLRLYSEVMSEATETDALLHTHSLGSFKNRLKVHLLSIQSKGSGTEWDPENFRLCIQKAKRKSPRFQYK